MQDTNVAERLQAIFTTPSFGVYLNNDIVGCEIGGALKNVIALASGMADGLGTGDNTRAAVITRGLTELTRLGVAMGGSPETLAGLARDGRPDGHLYLAPEPQPSLRRAVGRGKTVEQIAAEMNQVAEGVKSAPVVMELSAQYGVDMPISEQVARVVAGEIGAAEAYTELLARPRGFEGEVIT